MAFDGITVACIVKELNETLVNGRVNKISQPEGDELLLTVKTPDKEVKQHRLLLSADASLPLVYLTDENKSSPLNAPAFCMLLRKHLLNGRILSISQPSLERVIRFDIEHLDEMGDLKVKTLVIELMGKHSNIILIDDKNTILDSIKRVPSTVSSVREVLPGREYFIPQTMEKRNPLDTDKTGFFMTVRAKALPVFKALYTSFTGISPLIGEELCHRACLDSALPAASLTDAQANALYAAFDTVMCAVRKGAFHAELVTMDGVPKDYAALPLTLYHDTAGALARPYESMSVLLRDFYAEKETITRIRQKSTDLRRIVQTALERNVKKLDLQLNQLRDTQKKEKYRLYGELLTAYAYQIPAGVKKAIVEDYNTGRDVTIPLDETLTPAQNAGRYYERYNKLKRTAENLETLTKQVQQEIDHLESVAASLDIARQEEDLVPIRLELIETGYIKKHGSAKTKQKDLKTQPYHYVSTDGFDIYVGRNNFQNDVLTMKEASPDDWWFHAKSLPGSHVILKTAGREVPDRAFEEAAALAAYYSKGASQEKVEVDYVKRREIKKPSGAKPGYVIYYTNYSMVISPGGPKGRVQ